MSYDVSKYKPRLEKPEAGNPYYNTPANGGYAVGAILGNPMDAGCNVLSNCVPYAAGRFNEIGGYGCWKYFKYPPNAELFPSVAKKQGLTIGQEPQFGACMCWQKGATLSGSDGAGHVAIVEQINADGTIVTSESGYKAKRPFWTQKRSKGSGNWGQSADYKFLGFIYNPAVTKDESTEEKGGSDMTTWNGIDVSYCQGDVNWMLVKATQKVQFAILRAGYGRYEKQKDVTFENNYKGCKEHGIPVGAYWYSYAMSTDEAKLEAKVCLEVIKGKQFEYPIYFDLEGKKQFALGKESVTAIIKAFLETVEAAGYWVGLYMSKSFLEKYVAEDVRKRYAIWVAHYGVKKTTYKGQYGMWQYGTCTVDGIKEEVDGDVCYQDYPQLIKAKGLNGYGKKAVTQPKFTNYTVKTGDTLWGIARRFLGNGNRYKEIMYANGLTSERIYGGQVLRIPK